LNLKRTWKYVSWLACTFAIVGSAYMFAHVFPRISGSEADNVSVANKAPVSLGPCLELTSDQRTTGTGYGRIRGWVRNNCEKQFGYVEVEYKLYDANGRIVGGAMTNLAALGPYESWRFEAIAMQPYERYQLARVVGD
jgi:hypothetical protein